MRSPSHPACTLANGQSRRISARALACSVSPASSSSTLVRRCSRRTPGRQRAPRGFNIALKSTQWSLCTGAGCPADAKNPSSVASWTELCASEFVQNSEITMTPSYYLITDALKISPFSMCQQLRLDVLYEGSESCIPQFLHVSYGCTASSHWKGASGVFWLLNVQGLMEPEYTRTISGYTFYERRLVLKREESSPNVFRWYLRLSVLLNYEETYYLLGESDDTLQNWVFKCYPATFLVVPSQAHLTTTTVVGVSNSNPLLPGVAMDPNAQSVTLLTHETCSATSSTTPQPATSACAACLAGTFKPHLGDEDSTTLLEFARL